MTPPNFRPSSHPSLRTVLAMHTAFGQTAPVVVNGSRRFLNSHRSNSVALALIRFMGIVVTVLASNTSIRGLREFPVNQAIPFANPITT